MKSISRPKKDKPASDAATPTKFNRVVEIGRERKYVPAGDREQFGGDPTSSEEINSVIYLRANLKRVDLLIEPEVSGFSMSDYDSHDGLIAAGYEAARKALASWSQRPTP